MTPEQTAEYKRRYARGLLQGLEPWEAICRAIPDPAIDRVSLAVDWRVDEEVQAYAREIEGDEEDPIHKLPTKADFFQLLWAKMHDADAADCAKLAKVYGDVRGWTKKPVDAAPSVDNSTTTITNVMHVIDHGTDADWEHKAVTKQATLIAEGHALVADSSTATH